MITEGFVLNSCYNGHLEFVLAISDNDEELENKAKELTKLNNEKRIRFNSTENARNEYISKYSKCLDDLGIYNEVEGLPVIPSREFDYATESFVTNNPIPDEIKEFVQFIKDRDYTALHYNSESDFDVEFYVSNILGFRGYV